MLANAAVGIAVHRQVEAQSVVEFARELSGQRIQIGGVHRCLLPLCLKQVVSHLERESTIDLLTCNLERSLRVEVEQREQVPQEGFELISSTLRVRA